MKILYICHSLNSRTGIGHLVGSIMEHVRNERQGELSAITSEDLLPIRHKFKLLLNLKQIAARAKAVDLIHSFDAWPYGLLAVFLGWLVHKPVILTAVGTGSVQKLSRFPYSFMMKYIYRHSTKVTAISRYVQKMIEEKVPNVPILVVTPGIDTSDWAVDLGAGNPLKGKSYLFSVGTFKRRKGHDLALSVFKKLLSKRPDLYYVIVGKPDEKNSYYQGIDQQIHRHGLADRVIILDAVSEKEFRALYCDAELFILLSRADRKDIEGFGLVFLEAAAAGIPVIGSRNSGAEDAVLDGVNGYLVDPANEQEVISKVEKILDDQDLRKKLSDGSLAFARQMDWKNKIIDYLKLYEEI